ncbi:DUF2791 family P-loop domain-containing protein [Nannocystis pusilla]|uniref:DUF2791 family P-loop domain-containing protein n=1 Tax=Nannocystis pusilla TaxID=889268 RepID=A0A9X3J4N9_9BACT|nr:BREX system ATP-binding domain-containing protein [Nannocystis pusilla]MCY1013408.1 DUF2791 family P-loop domain-containing protein [Nannocystis pusilla]
MTGSASSTRAVSLASARPSSARPVRRGAPRAVALHLRRIYVPQDPERFLERITDAFIDRLVADVTAGFKGNVGVVPRQFLREFVTQMDLVDENPEYDPARDYAFKLPELSDLTAHEQHVITGQPLLIAEDATGEPVLKEDVW